MNRFLNGSAAFTGLVALFLFVWPAAGQFVYWADVDGQNVQFGQADGSSSPTISFNSADGVSEPQHVAIDEASGQVYWSDSDSSTIRVGNLDGSGTPVDLFSAADGLVQPAGIALDIDGGKIYWCDFGAFNEIDRIQVGNLDGSGAPTDLFDETTDGTIAPYGLAIDLAGGKIYWTELGAGRIRVGNIDGSGTPTTLYIEPIDEAWSPRGLALDLANDKIYWCDSLLPAVRMGDTDGSGPPVDLFGLGDALQAPFGVAVDLVGGTIYWADAAASKIQVGNLDGSGTPTDLFDSSDGLITPLGLALSSISTVPAQIVSVSIDGSLGQAYVDGFGDWTITFNESVDNMDVGDVSLVHTGSSASTGLSLVSFSKASGTSFTFRATGVTGVGTMTLVFTPSDVVTTSSGAPVTKTQMIGAYLSLASLSVSQIAALVLLAGALTATAAFRLRRHGPAKV